MQQRRSHAVMGTFQRMASQFEHQFTDELMFHAWL